jgi:hypothetical protein
VHQPLIKEPHYLISNNRRSSLYGFIGRKRVAFKKLGFLNNSRDYLSNFNNFYNEGVFIDASTLYSVHLDFTEELKKVASNYNLELKFLILKRDSYDRAVSHYRFSVSRREEYRTFKEAVEAEVNGDEPDWLLGGYLKGGLSAPLIKEIEINFPSSDVMELEIESTDLYSEDFWERLVSFLGIDKSSIDTNVYENKSEIYASRFAITIRYLMKRIRDLSPQLFERPIFRKGFSLVIAMFSVYAVKKELEVDMSRHDFMEHLSRLPKGDGK